MRTRTAACRALVFALACLAVAGCADTGGGEEEASTAAKVTEVKGTEFSRVTLTEDAVDRIGLELAPVTAGPEGTQIPYGAVVYDPKGASFAFVTIGTRSYMRQSISVSRVEGGVAFLTAGPPAGTRVVAVGATEIYGAENGVGDDE